MDTASHNLLQAWLVLLSLTLTVVLSTPVPAPEFSNPYEKYTNQTIDQLITSSLGGTDVAANQVLDFGENILAELDMFLTKEQFLNMYQPPQPEDMMAMGIMPAPLGTSYDSEKKNFYAPPQRKKRKATRDTTKRWTQATMPYMFAKGHFNSKEEYMMRRAMTEWERYTCIRFRAAVDSDKNSVRFQNGIGCNSQLGMVGGIQMLNLQAPGCRFKGLYLHEIGHALGLVHEHQLPNRDNFIRIKYNNVSPHMRIWFNKYTTSQVNQMDVPYQLSSVMHYGITAFSKDGKSQTIEALDRNKEDTIGRVYLKELAYTDVSIVNKMYHCSDHCPDKTKCGPKGHLDQNCDCICEDGSSDCDRTKRGVDANCVNTFDSWSCYIWANQGECERNSFYMNKYCTKACHQCGDSGSQGPCKDVYKKARCQMWKDRGDCVTNPEWMKRNCKATCNLCRDDQRPEINCVDVHSDKDKCKKWALDGECKVNAVWMFKNCRKSCQLCDKKGVDKGTTGGGGGDEDKMECKDTHKNCQRWASSGECQSNPDWMINNCRKACQKCDDGKCKNFYDDTKCEIWEQQMKCLSNSEWMSRHCAKSCKTDACKNGGGTGGGGDKETTRGTSGTTVKTTTTSSSCKNIHNSDKQCDMWAKNDHCNINPSWMLKYCAKSCGKCVGVTNVPTTTMSNRKTTTDHNGGKTIPDCADTRTQCPLWAEHGYCDSNARYNLIYCKKSCNNCNGCRDTDVLCSIWAEAGHCQKNARFMLRKCQKSCKACTSQASALELIPTSSMKPSTTPSGSTASISSQKSSLLIICCLYLLLHIY